MQFKLAQAMEVLTQTPAVLNALLRGKSAEWLNSRKTPESFSPLDVVGHLIHGDKTDWIPRAQLILSSGEPKTFEPFDRFAFKPLLAGMTVETLLDEFGELRRRNLQILRDLGVGDKELELPGIHPELGAVTLSNLLATWVVHDLGHISQILKTMANEYSGEVGAWREYLAILN
jgi:DinB superfamily